VIALIVLLAPFGGVKPLLFFNHKFDIPEHLLGKLAGGRAECIDHIRRVKIRHRPEIVVVKEFGGIETAAVGQRICHARGESPHEGRV
jgi:hypothetical protein